MTDMAITLKINFFILTLISVFVNHVTALWSEFEIRSIEDMNGTTGEPIFFNIRQKRIKKGVYGITGTIEMTDNFDDYETVVNIYHSATGNNQFKPSPLVVPRGPTCEKANGEYRKFIMNDLHKTSDLPYSEDPNEDLCKMFTKGTTYTVNDFQLDSSIIPKFMQSGLYKFELLLKKDDVQRCGLVVLCNLS